MYLYYTLDAGKRLAKVPGTLSMTSKAPSSIIPTHMYGAVIPGSATL